MKNRDLNTDAWVVMVGGLLNVDDWNDCKWMTTSHVGNFHVIEIISYDEKLAAIPIPENWDVT